MATIPTHIATKKQLFLLPKDSLLPPKDSSRHQKTPHATKNTFRHQKTPPATKKNTSATKKHLSRHRFYGSERVSYAYCYQEATSPATKKRVAYA